jgi:hypothetical protein
MDSFDIFSNIYLNFEVFNEIILRWINNSNEEIFSSAESNEQINFRKKLTCSNYSSLADEPVNLIILNGSSFDKTESDNMYEENFKLKQQKNDLKTLILEAEYQNEQIIRELNEKSNQFEILFKSHKQLENKIKLLDDENEDLKFLIEKLNNEIEELKNQNKNMKIIIINLQDEIDFEKNGVKLLSNDQRTIDSEKVIFLENFF